MSSECSTRSFYINLSVTFEEVLQFDRFYRVLFYGALLTYSICILGDMLGGKCFFF